MSSKLSTLRDLIWLVGSKTAMLQISAKAKSLPLLDVAKVVQEAGPQFMCPFCNDSREINGAPCPCCMRNAVRFHENRITRFAGVLLVVDDVMDELLSARAPPQNHI